MVSVVYESQDLYFTSQLNTHFHFSHCQLTDSTVIPWFHALLQYKMVNLLFHASLLELPWKIG